MKERLNSLLSEVGESVDYLRSDIRNLGRYLAELEGLVESYRAWASALTLSTPGERAARNRLLKRTLKVHQAARSASSDQGTQQPGAPLAVEREEVMR